jgi:iron complex outermembrane recepter protein
MKNLSLCRAIILAGASCLPVLLSISAMGADGSSDTELETIVVTAQKRSEDLQSVPQDVNVISAADLTRANTTQVRDLQVLVPGLNIQQSGPLTQFFIRGVGGVVTGPLEQPGVATNLDGVYTQSPTGLHGEMFDLAQVDVLKGPQGTLYGRNSTAGAVNLISNKPVFSSETAVGIDYGNFGEVTTSGMVNVPISDQIAVRAAFQTARHNGYYSDGFDDEDTDGVRLEALFNLSDALNILLITDYAHEGGKGSGAIPINADGTYLLGGPWAGPTSAPVQALVSPPYPAAHAAPLSGFESGYYGEFARQNIRNVGVSGTLNWNLDFGELTALTSYRSSLDDSVSYSTGFIVAPDTDAKETSAELRLASTETDAEFKWLGGLYYYHEAISGGQFVDFGDSGAVITGGNSGGYDPALINSGNQLALNRDATTNYAIFSQETFAITDWLRVTGGARYLHEAQDFGADLNSYTLGSTNTVGQSGSASWNHATWKAGVDADVAPRSMVYAYVANGWKAGGFNSVDSTDPNHTYSPETLTSYTLGSKNKFLDGRLQLNGELFYWDYDNRQVITFALASVGGEETPSPIFVNVGKSHIEGADLDINYLLTDNDLFGLSAEFIPVAKNDVFVAPSLAPLGPGCTLTPPFTYNCSGTSMPTEPKWAGTVSYQHTFNLQNAARVLFNLQTRFETKSDLVQSPTDEAGIQDAYTRTNLSLAYQARDAKWSAGVYVHNVENSIVQTAALNSPVTGGPWSELLAPRTYGVQLNAHF